jgi:hypothetical protein
MNTYSIHNRVNTLYYLFEGETKTKTGKSRYFFSTKPNGKGIPLDKIPPGYEIYEHPENAQIFIRKNRPQLITDLEQQYIKKMTSKLQKSRSRRYIFDVKDKNITIYESNLDINQFEGMLSSFGKEIGVFGQGIMNKTDKNRMDEVINSSDRNYTAMLRFCLSDQEKRTFTVERFCFRGSIDDWMYIDGSERLQKLADKYLNLLGTEEFFNLF